MIARFMPTISHSTEKMKARMMWRLVYSRTILYDYPLIIIGLSENKSFFIYPINNNLQAQPVSNHRRQYIMLWIILIVLYCRRRRLHLNQMHRIVPCLTALHVNAPTILMCLVAIINLCAGSKSMASVRVSS